MSKTIKDNVMYINVYTFESHMPTRTSDGTFMWITVDADWNNIGTCTRNEMQAMLDAELLMDEDSLDKLSHHITERATALLKNSHDKLIGKDVIMQTHSGNVFTFKYLDGSLDNLMIKCENMIMKDADKDGEILFEKYSVVGCEFMNDIRTMTKKEYSQWKDEIKVCEASNPKGAQMSTGFHSYIPTEQEDYGKEEEAEVKLVDIPDYYCPDLVNGSMTPNELARKLKTALTKKDAPKALTILLSGNPGTGKTMAAKFVANQLGKPIHSHKLGDLLDKYIGGSEKLIAEAFYEAEKQGAVLLIDEFDSISTNRDDSDRQHQTQLVNSVLQCLDDYKGIFFATTNREDSMDTAIKRRILLNMEFSNLTTDQALKMSKKFFPRRKLGPFEDVMYAPADFQKLKNQLVFVEDKDINSKYLASKLKDIANIRNGISNDDADKIPMGFNLSKS